jgi:hypothetical protein
MSDKPRIAVSKMPRTGDYLVGRDDELAILDQAWTHPNTCIVQIVAPGGVGKTQLVKKWQPVLRAFDWFFLQPGDSAAGVGG